MRTVPRLPSNAIAKAPNKAGIYGEIRPDWLPARRAVARLDRFHTIENTPRAIRLNSVGRIRL
jgi:hypothetical protein